MVARPAAALIVAVMVGASVPAAGEDDFNFAMPLGRFAGAGGAISLFAGSIGLNSQAGATYAPAKGDDPYYFRIPGQQPFQKVPGLLLRIPFGGGGSG